jgi:serine/threonine protein kinase
MVQLLSAISYCHSQQVIHRNLKVTELSAGLSLSPSTPFCQCFVQPKHLLLSFPNDRIDLGKCSSLFMQEIIFYF